MLWNGNECVDGNSGNEILKTTVPNPYYGRSKATGECEIFQIFWVE